MQSKTTPSTPSTPSAPPVLPQYFAGSALATIAASEMIGATYEMHVAAKVAQNSASYDTFLCGVYTWDSVSKSFVEYASAPNEGKAELIAGALSACHGSPIELVPFALKKIAEERATAKREVNTAQVEVATAKQEVQRLKERLAMYESSCCQEASYGRYGSFPSDPLGLVTLPRAELDYYMRSRR